VNSAYYPEIDQFFEVLAKEKATTESTEKLLDYYNKKTIETETLLNKFRQTKNRFNMHVASHPQFP